MELGYKGDYYTNMIIPYCEKKEKEKGDNSIIDAYDEVYTIIEQKYQKLKQNNN